MNIIKGLLDRIIFAIGVLLFMQVPHFIDQYEQRLGGYYQAQVKNLAQYQQIANQQHQGNLSALIDEFESSSKRSVQQTGNHVLEMSEQTEQLKNDVMVLANDSFVIKFSHVVTTLKVDIARAVIQTYNPAFPLSVEGLVSGLLGGVVLSLLFNALFGFPKIFSTKTNTTKKSSGTKVKQRVEPTIMRPSRAA